MTISIHNNIHHQERNLSGQNLSAWRGDRQLFSGLNFSLTSSQALFVTGHNGAGKTTLLRMLAGLSIPSAGELFWCAMPMRQALEEYRGEVLYIGHKAGNKDELSCLENLAFNLALFGHEYDEAACLDGLRQAGIARVADLPVRNLSQGQQRRVALARLVVSKARLWILDEPFTALDRQACGWVRTLLEQHLVSGGIAVLTSHQQFELHADVQELQLGTRS